MAPPKLNLPEKYLNWLDGVDEDAFLEIDGRAWALACSEELLETIEIEEDQVPCIEQARLLVKIIEEASGESSTEGNEIPFARIAGWLTIGCDNEDLLCVDPADNFSVWVFYPSEGGDVEKLADSLEALMEEAEQVELD